MKLKIGDVVRQKTGGLKMTVEDVQDGNIYVLWFEGDHLKRGVFNEDELELEESEVSTQ